MTMATTASSVLHFLEDRWDPAVAAGLDEPELLRYRSNLLGSDLRITNFAGGNTSSKVVETGSADRQAGGSAVGEGLGRRPGQHQAHRLCHALPGKAAGAGAHLQRRRIRRRDGGDVSAVRLPQQSSRRIHRHSAARISAVSARRSSASRLGDCAGGERQRQIEDGRVQSRIRSLAGVAAVAAAGL